MTAHDHLVRGDSLLGGPKQSGSVPDFVDREACESAVTLLRSIRPPPMGLVELASSCVAVKHPQRGVGEPQVPESRQRFVEEFGAEALTPERRMKIDGNDLSGAGRRFMISGFAEEAEADDLASRFGDEEAGRGLEPLLPTSLKRFGV